MTRAPNAPNARRSISLETLLSRSPTKRLVFFWAQPTRILRLPSLHFCIARLPWHASLRGHTQSWGEARGEARVRCTAADTRQSWGEARHASTNPCLGRPSRQGGARTCGMRTGRTRSPGSTASCDPALYPR